MKQKFHLAWAETQNKYSDIKGEKGIELRNKFYSPFFLRLGSNVKIEAGCRFYHPDRIVINDDVRINIDCLLYGSGGIWLGSHLRLGPRSLIHSANHDTELDSSLAFFERGYKYQQVYIGDNSLISANVSILPGVKLEKGSFVACGAVVVKNNYEQGSYLAGVPARDIRSNSNAEVKNYEPCPEIILVISNPKWESGARHLICGLGLPQVVIHPFDKPLPSSAHTIIFMGSGKLVSEPYKHQTVWTIEEGDIFIGNKCELSELSIKMPFTDSLTKLPLEVSFQQVQSPNHLGKNHKFLRDSTFWLCQRLIKNISLLSANEFLEWCCVIRLLNIRPNRSDEMFEWLMRQLWNHWPKEAKSKKPHSLKIASTDYETTLTLWFNYVSSVVIKGKYKYLSALRSKKTKNSQVRNSILQFPVLLIWDALNSSNPEDYNNVSNTIEKLFPSMNNSRQLLAAFFAADICDDKKLKQSIRGYFEDVVWWPENSPFSYFAVGNDTLCLSPLMMAWWMYLDNGEFGGVFEENIYLPDSNAIPISWTAFERSITPWEVKDKGVSLVDVNTKKISSSLIENWVKFHFPPDLGANKFYLNQTNYINHIKSIENIWSSLFDYIQTKSDSVLVKLKPWPAPYKAALSLRYDIDRPITTSKVTELSRKQATLFNAPCATWYFRGNNSDYDVLNSILTRHWQESGRHVETLDEKVFNEGATHHSSPSSCYWKGAESLQKLFDNGACYTEFLITDIGVPKQVFYLEENNKRDKKNPFYLIPLHFPLEGGTKDKDLVYFDKLIDYFHEKLVNGDHIIIGSHPDLSQSLLDQVVIRENLSGVWFATIEDVIKRIEELFFKAKIIKTNNVENSERSITLVSSKTIANVQIEIISKGNIIQSEVVQFNANAPRTIPLEVDFFTEI